MTELKEKGVQAVFHYLSLHLSDYYREHHNGVIPQLPNCDMFADRLVRFPLYYELSREQIKEVCENVNEYYNK